MTTILIDKDTEKTLSEKLINSNTWAWIRGACNALHVTFEDITGKSRKQNLCMVRFTLAWIMYSKGFTTKSIAFFLKRDRTTINNYIKQYGNFCNIYRR